MSKLKEDSIWFEVLIGEWIEDGVKVEVGERRASCGCVIIEEFGIGHVSRLWDKWTDTNDR